MPTAALEMFLSGNPRLTVLKTLKTSHRKVRFELRPVLKRFCRDTSRLCQFGPRWLFRPAFPKVPEGAAGKSAGLNHWTTVRGPSPLPLEEHGFKSAPWFLRYLVPLDAPLKELEARFHPSARRGIRKAEKQLVRVRCTSSAEDLRRFCDLHLETRRGHGLMPQPLRFFQRIHAHYLASGEGFLLVAEARGRLIAGV